MNKIRAILFTSLYLIIQQVLGWNLTGHVVVAQIAFDNLNNETKVTANALAQNIYQKLPENIQYKLDNMYPNVSLFAKVAVLPDVWHKWKAQTIFHKFDAPIPNDLEQYAQTSTAVWHYIDTPYPANRYCVMDNSVNIVQILDIIKYALPRVKDENTKSLLMVYTEHLVGDIHQPLHNITNITDGCGGDRGGNNVCLRYSYNGKCSSNLHSLWDKAGGYLKPHENIQAIAYSLQQTYPKAMFTEQLNNSSFKEWSGESYSYAKTVYSIQHPLYPMPLYYTNSQLIAKKQLVLAGYRLALILNSVL